MLQNLLRVAKLTFLPYLLFYRNLITCNPFNLNSVVSATNPNAGVSFNIVADDINSTSMQLKLDDSNPNATSLVDEDFLRNADHISIPGFPELPVISKLILIPPGADVKLKILNVDSRASEDFADISAELFHVGCSGADIMLAIEAEDGFIDTVLFSFPVDTARFGQPFGPDDYGYICVDDTDSEEWYMAPEFSWIDSNPD